MKQSMIGRTIKVMVVVTRLNVGGVALHVGLFTANMDPGRYRPTLVFGKESAGEGSMREVANPDRAEIIYLPRLGRDLSPLNDAWAFGGLFGLCRRLRPDVVHTHTAKAGTLGRLAARLAGVPVVIHSFHGHVFEGYFNAFWSQVVIAVERNLGRLTDCIVINGGSQLRDDIARFGIAPPDKLVIIPEGIDLQPYLSARSQSGQFRAGLGLPAASPLVGIVGRLAPVKNHRLFLAAARRVCGVLPEARFVIVGDGELRFELEQEAAVLGLEGRVMFVGWQPDLSIVYADLDLFTLTSLNEGVGLVLVEAMAAGCPVVATRVGGVPDVIQDGITGRLVESGDVEGLARAMREMLTDRARTRQMAEAARADVSQRYTVEALVRHTEALYERLLHEKGLA